MDSRIAVLISAAEKKIEASKYTEALDHIAAAEQIEPYNRSVRMVKELVKSLMANQKKPTVVQRVLSLTAEFSSGKFFSRQKAEPLSENQRRVRNLTSSADYFMSRGAIDNAFESLMRAYLLDPAAPEVVACEQRILPAWQKEHGPLADTKREQLLAAFPSSNATSESPVFERLKSGKLLE
jgi:predicted Zn-dependent protease